MQASLRVPAAVVPCLRPEGAGWWNAVSPWLLLCSRTLCRLTWRMASVQTSSDAPTYSLYCLRLLRETAAHAGARRAGVSVPWQRLDTTPGPLNGRRDRVGRSERAHLQMWMASASAWLASAPSAEFSSSEVSLGSTSARTMLHERVHEDQAAARSLQQQERRGE